MNTAAGAALRGNAKSRSVGEGCVVEGGLVEGSRRGELWGAVGKGISQVMPW